MDVSTRAFQRNRGWRRSRSRVTALSRSGPPPGIRTRSGSSTRLIDVGGRLVIPGINDAHDHPGPMPRGTRLGLAPISQHDPSLAEVLGSLKTTIATTLDGGGIFGTVGRGVVDDPNGKRFV